MSRVEEYQKRRGKAARFGAGDSGKRDMLEQLGTAVQIPLGLVVAGGLFFFTVLLLLVG
jgi:hypothetical protein